jgi:hypothetical protein
MDEENVLDFLTSLEAMDLPDRIEEVNARILSKIVQDTDYVAVLFCKCDHALTKFVKGTNINEMKLCFYLNVSCMLQNSLYVHLVPNRPTSISQYQSGVGDI